METNLTRWIERSIKDEAIVVFEPDKIKIGVELGAGAFSKVHKAELVIGVKPTIVAVKIFGDYSELQVDEKTQDDLIKEIRLLRTVGFYPNILSFHGISKVPNTDTYMLILEYADGGSLRDYLKSKELSGSEKIRLAKEIVSGVVCLHDSDIIHRDLNSANILVHEDHIKIADLGLSKKAGAAAGTVQEETTSKVHGYLQYIDPQCFIDINYNRSKKSDIYSIGVVFWELSSARIPFPNLSNTQAIAHIINGKREEPIAGTPREFVDLYTKCWDQEPENRPEIHEVFKKLEEIKWDTDATSTKHVGSSNKSTEISTTISEKLSDLQIVEVAPEEVTVLLNQFFDSGKEADDIRDYIHDHLREKGKTPEELFKMLMEEGNPDGDIKKHKYALLFGFCYYRGIGVDSNHDRAFAIFQRLADEDPCGQYFLGECYRCGFGVNPDREKSFYWYKRSAERGASNGQYETADCYRYGFGTEKDIEEAKYWYRKAADKKHFLARSAMNDESWQTEK